MTTATGAGAGRTAVERVHDDVVEIRRDLHRHPELSREEHRTAALAADRCEALGFAVRRGVGGTGVVADLDSGGGRTVVLRADMDALPITERGDGRVAVSETPGVMHACGHDGHVAMALGAASVLAGMRDAWSGRVRMCFQPAEEIASGAEPMLAEGAGDGADMVFGIHLWAPLPAGVVAVTSATLFGSADRFRVTVRGRGGHGGMPHTSVDPVPAAAAMVTALQTLVSRETSPFDPAVVTVGRIEGGTAFNVIAEEVTLHGTVRAVTEEHRERLLRRVDEVCGHVAAAHRCESEFVHDAGTPAVINDAGAADVVRAAAREAFGDDRVVEAQPITVGDDMALFLRRAPGCYFLVGAGGPAPHHHPEFDIDEACLDTGVETLVRATLRALAGP